MLKLTIFAISDPELIDPVKGSGYNFAGVGAFVHRTIEETNRFRTFRITDKQLSVILFRLLKKADGRRSRDCLARTNSVLRAPTVRERI